jgi:NADPH-dependent curcumin reductase CurA
LYLKQIQIAKLKGCRVVGICGSDDKVEYVHQLGADEVINYKKHSADTFKLALEKACPKGIDIYFDNTGGMVTDAVFLLINLRARIIICGQISQYNNGLDIPGAAPFENL